MWSNVRIGRKLLAGFGAMLAVTLALGTAWVFQSHGLTKELESAVNVTARKQHLAGEIRTSSAEILASENAIVLGSVWCRKTSRLFVRSSIAWARRWRIIVR